LEEELKNLIKSAVLEAIAESGLTTEKADVVPEIMDLKQAAEFLHFKPSYLRNRKDDLQIPYKRTGRKFVFTKNELLEWAQQRAEEKKSNVRIVPAKTKGGISKLYI